MADVSTWSPIAASNNQTPPDGWRENMLPSQVNDTGREMMAAIRRLYDDIIAQVDLNGSFFSTANGGIGGYFIDGFLAFTGDNSDQLYVGHNPHWPAVTIGSPGASVTINDTATFRWGQVTVANLPAASVIRTGQHMTVINASGPTYGATVVGGGSTVVDVICNGTNWVCC